MSDPELFLRYHRDREREVRDRLVVEHDWLARACAKRFLGRGEPLADLNQVARFGLVKAVERFDPTLGNQFTSFAVPTMMGELRRHFRDASWSVHVPRRHKELLARIVATQDRLGHELGRSPRAEELAEALEVDLDAVLEALEANSAYRCLSLDAGAEEESGPLDLHRRLGEEDAELQTLDVRITATDALATLDERSQQIVVWRFYEGCTQREIGQRLGLGQVQVSRLLRAALDRLREHLAGSDSTGHAATTGA